jgi:hypothetical protein
VVALVAKATTEAVMVVVVEAFTDVLAVVVELVTDLVAVVVDDILRW